MKNEKSDRRRSKERAAVRRETRGARGNRICGWHGGDRLVSATVAALLTAGLCRLMEKEGHRGEEICVGYDRRFLSKESAHWIAEVLAGYGFRTLMVNRSSPTPLIMYVVKTAAYNEATAAGFFAIVLLEAQETTNKDFDLTFRVWKAAQ